MKRSAIEQDQKRRMEEFYLRAQLPMMQSMERTVCGCDYGGNSWTTQAEAEEICQLLGLSVGLKLLDVGAGSGWPGLYMADQSGCDVTLVDLTCVGLQIAAERAARDSISGTSWISVADASMLPFAAGSFDAISHSDLLCCLPRKGETLTSCRDALSDFGRMVFTVISVVSGLSPDDYARAVACGPDFVESPVGYAELLQQTGWQVLECRDITREYTVSCRRQLQADCEREEELRQIMDQVEIEERQNDSQSRFIALADGLLRRELFVTTRAEE